MAEFSELVRIKKRICAKYKHNGNCNGCPVGAKFLCEIIAISDYDDMSFKACEDTLLSWAEEHPAPVYPSWYAWLANMGIVPIELPPDQAILVTDIGLLKKIPADIAQKLGIEPKEVK